MAGYRIDELALLAGTNVRNVRVCQDRGCSPRACHITGRKRSATISPRYWKHLKREAVTPVRSE
jgi:predicted RNA-binding Zn ribbon-like protein